MLPCPFSAVFLKLTLANPPLDVKRVRVPRCSHIKRACVDGNLCPSWHPVILSVSDESKITQEQTVEEKFQDGGDGRARRAADALRPLHDLRFRRPRGAGRSGCFGPRQYENQDRATGARALTMPDRGCTHIAALRLPRAARIVAENNRAGAFRYSGLLAARRARNRFDEQVARL